MARWKLCSRPLPPPTHSRVGVGRWGVEAWFRARSPLLRLATHLDAADVRRDVLRHLEPGAAPAMLAAARPLLPSWALPRLAASPGFHLVQMVVHAPGDHVASSLPRPMDE